MKCMGKREREITHQLKQYDCKTDQGERVMKEYKNRKQRDYYCVNQQ